MEEDIDESALLAELGQLEEFSKGFSHDGTQGREI